jgi:nucleoside-diphosphate-sugar epimerase
MSVGPVLVTGGAGFIGTRVKALLTERGTPVVAIDHSWHMPNELARLTGEDPLRACIHLGWYANPSDYLTADAPNSRSLADSIALVERLRVIGCEHLVVAGSCAEYADSSAPLREDSPIGPRSVYGTAKTALRESLERSSPPGTLAWARLFNLTGPGEQPGRVVPMVTRSLLAGEPVDLSPGEQVRDYLDVDDVAAALVHLAGQRVSGVVNVCSGDAVSLRHLLTAVADRVGGQELLRFGSRDYRPNESMAIVGNNTLLRDSGWTRSYTFSAMIDRVITYWKEHSPR